MRYQKIFDIRNDQNAQMHTLEAIMAATLMVVILIFAVQATALTPLTSSTANAHIESQMYTMGQDMLMALDHTPHGQNSSDLKEAILIWNGETYTWNNTIYKSNDDENSPLEGPVVDLLDHILVKKGIAHNVEFSYSTVSGSDNYFGYNEGPKNYYIFNGQPSDNAVIVSRKVLLSDSDVGALYEDTTGIPDIDDTTALYNIVDVRLTLWRM
ncbi:hypothetical protein LI82_09660 [Methanococcoides methylutens]|uniref:Uncharacterized protein n=1 Tax=Methanococcoides methylutens TaxID=2226 RepID=A0A099SZ87_METMT|nr:hypothetical protein [Methanococcoides methylutens]KGK98004.1 hypothetical protein LI82_09660 [Methanococcoides methylutens]